jgi:hypothetical protein
MHENMTQNIMLAIDVISSVFYSVCTLLFFSKLPPPFLFKTFCLRTYGLLTFDLESFFAVIVDFQTFKQPCNINWLSFNWISYVNSFLYFLFKQIKAEENSFVSASYTIIQLEGFVCVCFFYILKYFFHN